MGMLFAIASRNLIQARRRTMFLTAALGLTTMLLVLLTSLSEGLSATMIRAATTLSSGHVNVAGFFKATASDAAPIINDTDKLRALVAELTPGVDYIVDRHRGWARIVSETGSLQSGLTGIDITAEPRFAETLQLAPESEYVTGGADVVKGDLSKLAEPNTALIFAGQARRLGVTVGDALTITIETLSGQRNTTEVRVVAIGKDLGMLSNFSVFVPKKLIWDLYQLEPSTSGAVMVYLKDIERANEVMAELHEKLAARGFAVMEHEPTSFFMKFEKVSGEDWRGQKLDLTIWKDEVSFLTWALNTVNGISFFLITILMIIIAMGIMNSMFISVRERTREIGTLRAIGMGKGAVLGLFMMEAVLLGLFATSLGGGVGAAIALAVDAAHIHIPVEAVQSILMSDTLHLVVTVKSLVTAIVIFTVVTALSALWPALKAARLAPVTAIQATL